MRVLVQRVGSARVVVGGETTGEIDHGLLVYVGIAAADDEAAVRWMAEKLVNLRIFNDDDGKLNRSVQDARGGILLISNVTLLGDGGKGRRPSFVAAAPSEDAGRLHQKLAAALKAFGCAVAEGVFGADMTIDSQADGPVNIVLDRPASNGS